MLSLTRLRAAIVALVVTSLSGCPQEMASLRQSFAHPGSAAYQRAQAQQHDPYVLNDVGPEVVGGRPRDYLIPINEVERARINTTPPLTPVAAPAVVVGPPPAGASPAVVTVPTPGAPSLPPTTVAAPI